ncbi:MAG: 6-phosphogluconolactonase [Cytophagales bacterium]|nr:MAG: 6-phosphogluconolactonase [Cytophagales bacterium]
MNISVAADPAQLARNVADWMLAYERAVLAKQGRFTIALSGGSTPKALHQLLAKAPYRDKFSWDKWHVFWGDERYVPRTDERNNARMAFDTLLNHVPVPNNQIHEMRTSMEPIASMQAYEKTLHRYFDGQPHTFDLVLLGMGDDGHTLSLFPNTPVVREQTAWTSAYFLKKQNMYRLTLTAQVVNRSAAVAFMVAGANKAEPLREVLEGKFHPQKYPAQIIQPAGELYWFVDRAASGEE